jgi:hypothetical protein
MDPITGVILIKLILALVTVAGIVIVHVALLTWNRLLDWFLNKRRALSVDEKTLSVLLNHRLSSGKFKEIQCLYDRGTNKLEAATIYEADNMDETLKAHHRDNELLIIR